MVVSLSRSYSNGEHRSSVLTGTMGNMAWSWGRMRAPLSRVIAEVWLRKALCGSRNAMVLSGDLELKLKSLSIQRMRDSSVCPVPASLPPNPVLPTWKFSLPVLPWRCPPVWDASLWGSREMLWRHAAKLYQDQHCTIPHPGFLCCPCHSPRRQH